MGHRKVDAAMAKIAPRDSARRADCSSEVEAQKIAKTKAPVTGTPIEGAIQPRRKRMFGSPRYARAKRMKASCFFAVIDRNVTYVPSRCGLARESAVLVCAARQNQL